MDSIETYKYTKEEISEILKDDLKNHYTKRDNVGIISVGPVNEYHEKNIKEDKEIPKVYNKFKYKFAVKLVGALAVVATFFAYDYFPENIKTNKVCSWIKKEYIKNYSKVEVIENVEEYSKKMYSKIKNIIPENLYIAVIDKYVNNIKPKIIDFKFSNLLENKNIDNTVTVFNENDIEINREELTLAEEALTTSSEISLMDIIKDDKNTDLLEKVDLKNNISLLQEYLCLLNDREKEIIIKRYGLNNTKDMTQKEIADELKISRSYVSRIEKRALTKMLTEFIRNKNID